MKDSKKWLFITMMTTMIFSVVTTAYVGAEEMNDGSSAQLGKVAYEHKAVRPHFNFYYQLLAEKYAPKHVKVWHEVMKEREALFKHFIEMKKDGKELADLYDETWLKEHSEIHEQFLKAVEKRDDEALKVVVPQIIDHQKELNRMLKKRLKELN